MLLTSIYISLFVDVPFNKVVEVAGLLATDPLRLIRHHLGTTSHRSVSHQLVYAGRQDNPKDVRHPRVSKSLVYPHSLGSLLQLGLMYVYI